MAPPRASLSGGVRCRIWTDGGQAFKSLFATLFAGLHSPAAMCDIGAPARVRPEAAHASDLWRNHEG
jgi:hypothetical protein